MLIKILGVFDLFVALILFLLALEVNMPALLLIVIIVVLAVKSLPFIFTLDIGSIIDVIIALVLAFAIFFSVNALILVIAALVIGQKGVFSLL